MKRPPNRPKCKHGGIPGNCKWCSSEELAVRNLIKPLADEWWSNGRDARSLERQLIRAYHIGEHQSIAVKDKL